MSFFGFDPSGPPGKFKSKNNNNNNRNKGKKDDFETFDFQETYDGLGENALEEEDAFNDETFGTDIQDIGSKDFDFATGQLKTKGSSAPPPSSSHMSYAQAAQVDEILQPMASLWNNGDSAQQQQSAAATAPAPAQTQAPVPEKKILSLEEIEAKLRAQPVSQPQPLQQQPQQQFGNPMPGNMMLPYFMLPPQVQQHLLSAAVASGHFPDVQSAHQALMAQAQQQVQAQGGFIPPPQGMPPFQNMPPQGIPPQGMPPQGIPPQGMPPQGIPPQFTQQPPTQAQQAPQSHSAFNQAGQPEEQKTKAQAAPRQFVAKSSNSEFPVLGADSASPQQPQAYQQQSGHSQQPHPEQHNIQHQNQNQNQNQHPHQQQQQQRQNPRFNNNNNNNNNNYNNNNNINRHHQRQLQQQQQLENMTPEEHEKFLVRQAKVQRITSSSGFMNPKDKDFVTRFQLSQIVTEDPYNEDFYCQVYEVLNSQTGENNMNSIAEKYLEQSGHRLGGRMKRADVALQRMQQQVSKAVSVAKERGERTNVFSREGALGKVSVGNVKQPKKRLVLIDPENDSQKEISEIHEDSTIGESNVTEEFKASEIVVPKEYKFSKSIRSFQLSIIENVYKQVLKLESMERENLELNTNDLIKSLHLDDKINSITEGEINPFISILSFDKTMKLFNRIFHFLSNDQQFKIISVIFSNLQKIEIVFKSSYKNYLDNKGEIPAEINSKIELFQSTIMKNLVFYLSDAKFSNVLEILTYVIQYNNVLFLSTTKIGLSLITILISRLELTKQDSLNSLSQEELSNWQLIYDQLFKNYKNNLSQVFPTYLSSAVESNELVTKEDDSYIWQFLASLSLAGLLDHQRIIIDEIRNEIFGVMNKLKKFKELNDTANFDKYLNNLNLFLNVMGLKANENDITEL